MQVGRLALAAASAAILAGCGTAHGTAAPKTAATRSAASSAPSAAPSATLTPWENWCYGDGWTRLQAVTADINQTRVDIDNGQMGTATQDGQQLTQDAQTAESEPPPESPGQQTQYVRYMKDAEAAGGQFYQDNSDGAMPWMSRAAGQKKAVQTAAGQCNSVMGGA